MTRDFATDPEVLADLRTRESSERDSSRSREARYDWRPAAIVEHWRCKGCGALVGVTRQAVETREVFNARLKSRGEAELAKDKIVFCPSCKAGDEDLQRMQLEAQQAARRPREQLGMQLGDKERASGMVQRENRRRSK